MKLWTKAAVLSTCCFLAACADREVLVPLAPPADRLDCVALEARPSIPAEYVIDWTKVTTVAQARGEHEAYVRSIRTREGVIVGHIVEIENRLFLCASDDAWLRDFYKGLPR